MQGGAGLCLGTFGGLSGSSCVPPTLCPPHPRRNFLASPVEWDLEAPGCALARTLAWNPLQSWVYPSVKWVVTEVGGQGHTAHGDEACWAGMGEVML